MKKLSDVYKSIRFAKMDPSHDKSHKGGSQDDEEHYTVGEKEYEQQVKHVKKRAMQEEKKDKYDEGEYDREGDMAKSDLRSIIANAKRLHDMIEDADNLPEWVQSKITIAEDYVSTVANYMTAEMNEAFKMPPESVAEKMARSHAERRKKSGLPDPSHYLKISAQKKKEIEDMKKEEVEIDEARFSGLKPNFNKKPILKQYGDEEKHEPDEIKNSYHKEKKERIKAALEKTRQERFPNLKNEEVNMNESGGDVVFKKGEHHIEKYGEDSFALYKDGKKQKYYTTIDAAKSAMKEDIGLDEASKFAKMFDKRIKQRELNKLPKPPKSEYENKVDKYLKKKYQKEEIELQEGRPSQRHPLEGHDYHKKSNAELIGIAKDAHEAAEAMKGHSTRAENKYRDQANDSATVRYFRQKSGMPDWYKKKYGHVKEETEYLEEKNVPTSPEKWAQAKAQAKAKFDVYPSAYANGWAAKKYKEMGGGWKSVSEGNISESRKTDIIKKLAKKKTNIDDKFEPNPIMTKNDGKENN